MRFRWILLFLLAAALATWLAGRPPGAYALVEACREYQEERAGDFFTLQMALNAAERAMLERRAGASEEVDRLRSERDAALTGFREYERRGWRVRLIPASAARPSLEGYTLVAEADPARLTDPAPLRGRMQAWVAPEGPLARLLAALPFIP